MDTEIFRNCQGDEAAVVGAVISFCSHDAPFLDRSIQELKKFCKKIVVTVSDHLFNGEKEDEALINAFCKKHEDVTFIY